MGVSLGSALVVFDSIRLVVVMRSLSLAFCEAKPAVNRKSTQKKMPVYLGQPEEKAIGRMHVTAPSRNT